MNIPPQADRSKESYQFFNAIKVRAQRFHPSAFEIQYSTVLRFVSNPEPLNLHTKGRK